MQQYVVGFLFRKNKTEVALIRKEKPDWQRGKLNGVGGKVEPGESEYAAQCREFKEETGATIRGWVKFVELTCGGVQVHCFHAEVDNALLLSQTDEEVAWYPVALLSELTTVIENLRWLIPMALDNDSPYADVVSGFSGK